MSTNQSTPSSKVRVIKSLAVVGFIGIIIAIAWLSMQLVHVVPGAFASLASLAEGVRQYQGAVPNTSDSEDENQNATNGITLTSDSRTITVGEPTTLRWSTASTPGSYTFSYACADGVAIDLDGVAGLTSIACDTNYNLGNVNSVTLRIDSEKERFAEVSYEIAFLRTNDTEPRARTSQTIAVVNQSIPEFSDIDTPSLVPDTVTTPSPTTPTPSTPTQPSYQQEFVYAIPTSDPNGTTDLTVRFLGVGQIINNTFFTSALTRRAPGAIQFEVKNIGTKTSRTWTYSAKLPDNAYTSTEQAALKPNERAVITLGFGTPTSQLHQFDITVTDATDRNSVNNRLIQPITIQ